MRRTERFAGAPLRTAWTAARFTLRELASGSITFRTEDGLVLAPGQIEIVSVANPGESHVAAKGEHASGAAIVAMATLDDALAGEAIGPVDYLKIDVEGFELPVLRGARRTIAASPAIVVQTELQDQHASRYGFRTEEVASPLSELGLRPHLPRSDGPPQAAEGRLRGDILWLRP
jgi:hypothetical protein